jgi:hypothetical protein
MLTLFSVLLLAPVPKDATKPEAPAVKHVGTVERGGHVYLQFEFTNPTAAPLHYVGYTSDSFEGGLKEGVISPLYRLETKRGKEWKAQEMGWCKTGRGPVTISAKGKGTFEVVLPAGEWDEVRFGVTWFTGADRKTSDVAWGAVARKDAEPKKP